MGENAVFKLEVENGLCVVVGDQEQSVGLELIDGHAEIFGTEMELNKVYTFPKSSSISVFSWQGCSIKVIGAPLKAYIFTDTYIILHVILHACLEQDRLSAEANGRRGPITLVVGPQDSGKSTLCRFLVNYAARMGRKPFLIDLDVGQGSLSIPGTINILNVDRPADIVDGFKQDALQTYHFGYKSPSHLIASYFFLIKKLGERLPDRLREAGVNARSSGVVIDTCGWTEGLGYNVLTLAANSFKIDRLVVVSDENLHNQLKKDMPLGVEVLFMPKMPGVAERDRPYRIDCRKKRVREHFYGSTVPVQTYTYETPFSDVKIYKVERRCAAAEQDFVDISLIDLMYNEVSLGPHLLNQVIAVSSSDYVSDEVLLKNVIGFICIQSIDVDQNTLTILSLQPPPLPKKILFVGDIKLVM